MLNIVYEQLLLLIYPKTKPHKSVLYYYYKDCKDHDAFGKLVKNMTPVRSSLYCSCKNVHSFYISLKYTYFKYILFHSFSYNV